MSWHFPFAFAYNTDFAASTRVLGAVFVEMIRLATTEATKAFLALALAFLRWLRAFRREPRNITNSLAMRSSLPVLWLATRTNVCLYQRLVVLVSCMIHQPCKKGLPLAARVFRELQNTFAVTRLDIGVHLDLDQVLGDVL